MNQPAIDIRAQRDAYYRRIAAKHLTPLWESMSALVPEHPQSPCVPMIWRYDEVRPWLLESGQLISAQEAVRRVLILENPGLPGASPRSRATGPGIEPSPGAACTSRMSGTSSGTTRPCVGDDATRALRMIGCRRVGLRAAASALGVQSAGGRHCAAARPSVQ